MPQISVEPYAKVIRLLSTGRPHDDYEETLTERGALKAIKELVWAVNQIKMHNRDKRKKRKEVKQWHLELR